MAPRPYYIVYYRDGSYCLVRSTPVPEDFPGSGFAEGPFKSREDAINRLRCMGRKVA